MRKWLSISFLILGLNLKAQKVSMDTIKSKIISIHPDYKLILKSRAGWNHYANYYYLSDSLIIFERTIVKFMDYGKTEMIFGESHIIGHGKYKLKGDRIKLLPARELKQGLKRRRWASQKIVKIAESYIILESNFENKKIRHVYIRI